jgi:hypothetical protein
MFIEIEEITYQKLLEFCEGRDMDDEIYALVVWAQKNMPEAPATVKTVNRYYDTEKYKRTAAADLRRTSPEDVEAH